jgi:predicted dehydrogenase
MDRQGFMIIGCGQRGEAYARYALDHPEEARVLSVVDPDPKRRDYLGSLCGVPGADRLADWGQALAGPKLADAVVVATPDNRHVAPCLVAIAAGYDVLLEKPISSLAAECLALRDAAKAAGRKVVVCHVLRYTPFFTEIKRIVDSGTIGKPVSIDHVEGVGYWHQAHSFVRGNWRNSAASSPMILQKSCHDMDILRWIVGAECRVISSFGSLSYFTAANAPEGAPARCTDGCPASATCPYDAVRYYLTDIDQWAKKILRKVVAVESSDEAVLAALKTGPYGRCVFRCDNDVVDHQTTTMEFEGGATATFTMSAFNPGGRTIEIMGTKGRILGDMEASEIEIFDFLSGSYAKMPIGPGGEGHGGGDSGIMRDFCAFLGGGAESPHLSTIAASIESHLMALAAEESRVRGRTVYMNEFAR